MAHKRKTVTDLEQRVVERKKKYVRYQEGAELYYMGLNTFREIAREAKATVRIKGIVLVNFETKAIYGMMIDRVSLSVKNGWLDGYGKTYIHYSVADIIADTGCGKNKILKCLKELEEDVIDGMDEYQTYSEIIRGNIDMESLGQ